MRGNGLTLWQGRFILDIRETFLMEQVVRYWNGLPKEVVESLSQEVTVFKKSVDMEPQDIV